MAVNRMHEWAPADVAHVNNRHRNQLLRRKTAIRERVTPKGQRSTSWRALRVLIVDDEQDRTNGLFTQIRSWGHVARMAYHGLAALMLAADQHPDVVLLDIELPSLDGRHLARRLRLDAPQKDCFIIALADWADEERCRQCSQAGIDLTLTNPLDPSVLEVLLLLECVRMNGRRAAEAGHKPKYLK